MARKLTDDQVREIFARLAAGERAADVSRSMTIPSYDVAKIARRKTYASVPVPPEHVAAVAMSRRKIAKPVTRMAARQKALTASEVAQIRRRYPAEAASDLAKEFQVTRATIYHITTGRTWRRRPDE